MHRMRLALHAISTATKRFYNQVVNSEELEAENH